MPTTNPLNSPQAGPQERIENIISQASPEEIEQNRSNVRDFSVRVADITAEEAVVDNSPYSLARAAAAQPLRFRAVQEGLTRGVTVWRSAEGHRTAPHNDPSTPTRGDAQTPH